MRPLRRRKRTSPRLDPAPPPLKDWHIKDLDIAETETDTDITVEFPTGSAVQVYFPIEATVTYKHADGTSVLTITPYPGDTTN